MMRCRISYQGVGTYPGPCKQKPGVEIVGHAKGLAGALHAWHCWQLSLHLHPSATSHQWKDQAIDLARKDLDEDRKSTTTATMLVLPLLCSHVLRVVGCLQTSVTSSCSKTIGLCAELQPTDLTRDAQRDFLLLILRKLPTNRTVSFRSSVPILQIPSKTMPCQCFVVAQAELKLVLSNYCKI